MTENFSGTGKLAKASEEESTRLRIKLWKARGRRSRITGMVYLILSGSFLILAYVTRYIVFEVISILSLLLGVVFVFISVEAYVKTDVANKAVISPLIPLASLLNHLKVESKAIFIPPLFEQKFGKIFIPKQIDMVSLPTFEEIEKENSLSVLEKGILMPTVGSALLQLYEDELGDLRKIDLEYLITWLPRVLVDGLQMAEKVEITYVADEVQVKMANLAFRNVCRHYATKVVCEVTGCPVCSSIGEAISKHSSRIVYFIKCENDLIKRETSAFYKLGMTLEDLKRRKQ